MTQKQTFDGKKSSAEDKSKKKKITGRHIEKFQRKTYR